MRPRFQQIPLENPNGVPVLITAQFYWDRDEVIEGLVLAPVDNSDGISGMPGNQKISASIDRIKINGRDAIAQANPHPSLFYPSRLRERLHVPVRKGGVLEIMATVQANEKAQAILVLRPVMDDDDWKRETFCYRLSAGYLDGTEPLNFCFEHDYELRGLSYLPFPADLDVLNRSWRHLRWPHASIPAVRNAYKLATIFAAVGKNTLLYPAEKQDGYVQLRCPAEDWRTPSVPANNMVSFAPCGRMHAPVVIKQGTSFDVVAASRVGIFSMDIMTVGEHLYGGDAK